MAFMEDIAQFFDTDDFAVEATFTSEGTAPATIYGIFDDEYVAVESDGMVDVSSSMPVFHCASSDVNDAQSAALVIDAVTYRIVEVKPDGTGTTMLVLELQS